MGTERRALVTEISCSEERFFSPLTLRSLCSHALEDIVSSVCDAFYVQCSFLTNCIVHSASLPSLCTSRLFIIVCCRAAVLFKFFFQIFLLVSSLRACVFVLCIVFLSVLLLSWRMNEMK